MHFKGNNWNIEMDQGQSEHSWIVGYANYVEWNASTCKMCER